MKKRHFFLILAVFLYLSLLVVLFFLPENQKNSLISPFSRNFFEEEPKPLEEYGFESLRQKEYQGSEIKLEEIIKEEEKYTSWLFSFQTDGKKVTGMANLPKKEGKLPVIVMLRGYADDEIYFTGLGTRKSAGVFAENGFLTLAPDFLGFGGSDTSSLDILEARFERPVTVLNLLASIKSLPQVDAEKILMWGHSNGGQIALSVLEISQRDIPTVLWAPVTKGFPESVLQYMTELDDQGLKVKKAIDGFTSIYESKYFSIDHYWQDIHASLQVHQGTADDYIKTEWTDDFVQKLKDLNKDVFYYKYSQNDHNLSKDWDLVVQRDLEFFKKHL
jgi:uncharacterized protein